MARCVALFSGGLDSMLAVRMMQEQGIDVVALNFKTVFTCCQDQAGQAAAKMGIELTVITQDDDYFQLVRKPSFGFGRAANPCIDCRIYMFQKSKIFMEQAGATFVISGEIVGQRPKSQKRRDLEIISHHSGLDDLLLRPLSAQRLPPTQPEREGTVDRTKLGNFVGRSRKGLMRLAERYGFTDIPAPSTGCQLTEPRFSRKVFDHVAHESENGSWGFELLKYGRHFRLNSQSKLIVGRNESDNESLKQMHRIAPDPASAALVQPDGFPGPYVLVTGEIDEHTLEMAGAMLLKYASPEAARPSGTPVEISHDRVTQPRWVNPRPEIDSLLNIATVPGRC